MIRIVGREAVSLGAIEVSVRSGLAWITRRGRSEDWVLEAGQRMVLPGSGWVAQNLRPDEELWLRMEPLRGRALRAFRVPFPRAT
jgi:hypothetical protein